MKSGTAPLSGLAFVIAAVRAIHAHGPRNLAHFRLAGLAGCIKSQLGVPGHAEYLSGHRCSNLALPSVPLLRSSFIYLFTTSSELWFPGINHFWSQQEAQLSTSRYHQQPYGLGVSKDYRVLEPWGFSQVIWVCSEAQVGSVGIARHISLGAPPFAPIGTYTPIRQLTWS